MYYAAKILSAAVMNTNILMFRTVPYNAIYTPKILAAACIPAKAWNTFGNPVLPCMVNTWPDEAIAREYHAR